MADEDLKVYLELANRIIVRMVGSATTEPLPSEQEVDGWRQEILNLMTENDRDLRRSILDALTPHHLLFIAGMMMGRRSMGRLFDG